MHAILLSLALAAPTPAPKVKPEPLKMPKVAQSPHVGSWRMEWNGSEGDVIFYKEGGYWCLWQGQQWVGYWRLDGRRLTVTEGLAPQTPDGVPGEPITWTVELDGKGMAGDCAHNGHTFPFALKRP